MASFLHTDSGDHSQPKVLFNLAEDNSYLKFQSGEAAI